MDTEERIARLEAQIAKLNTRQAELHNQLAQAQVDQWQGRLDDLEVQLHLGAMEANDRLGPLLDQLRGRFADVRGQLVGATTTATSVADTLRTGIENASIEIRKALVESKVKVSS